MVTRTGRFMEVYLRADDFELRSYHVKDGLSERDTLCPL
jgi:hypothetical protein